MSSMKMGLQMKMSQQLIMTPQLQQAIKLLQLSRVELEDLIDKTLIENPALEIMSPENEDDGGENNPFKETEEKKEAEPEVQKDFQEVIEEQNSVSMDDEWQKYIESGAGVIQDVKNYNYDPDEENNLLEATISKSTSLKDHLLWQLDMAELEGFEKVIGESIIGNIDEDGYLSVSLRQMLVNLPVIKQMVQEGIDDSWFDTNVSPEKNLFDSNHISKTPLPPKKKKKKKAPIFEEDNGKEVLDDNNDELLLNMSDELCRGVEQVLESIQEFDPAGVGSRNLEECLRIQLFIMGLKDSLAYKIVEEDLNLLEQKDLRKVARRQKVSIEEVVEAYQLIISLEPKPGRPFDKEVTQYVTPDVYIYKRSDDYIVNLNQDSIPKIRINPYYQQIATKSAEETQRKKEAEKGKEKEVEKEETEEDLTAQYLTEKIKSGEWLMKSIEQRQKTIFKVATSILKYQKEFFEKGIDFLRPLVLKTVADDIDVHESTVSRITTHKYMHTPQGIFELKYFFTSGIAQSDGDVISSKKIKDQIRKLIEAEDLKKPYTDIQIAEALKERENIKVARRTVAKYREAMNILPSNKRKRLF